MVKSDLYLKPQLPPSAQGIWRRTGKARYALLGAINCVKGESVTSGWESPVPWPLVISGQMCEELSKLLTHPGSCKPEGICGAVPMCAEGLIPPSHHVWQNPALSLSCKVSKPTAWMNTVLKCWAVNQNTHHHAPRHPGPPAVYISSKQVHRRLHHRHPPHALSYQEQKTCWCVQMLFMDDSAAFGTIVAFKLHYEDILGPERPPSLTGRQRLPDPGV